MASKNKVQKNTTKKTKYIFVVGGVMSGVGKGVASSSIAKILQGRGLGVTAIKIDPYVNIDAGTMNPTEHGEVFVLDDGGEVLILTCHKVNFCQAQCLLAHLI